MSRQSTNLIMLKYVKILKQLEKKMNIKQIHWLLRIGIYKTIID